MQVNSVSLNNSSKAQVFKSRQSDIEKVANLDENTIRQLAYAKASYDVDDKKHKRITNALYYTLPVAFALGEAIKNPAELAKSLANSSKVNMGRYARVHRFAGAALGVTAALLAIDTVVGAKNLANKHSSAVREFSNEHPVLSMLGTVAVGFAALAGLHKYAPKLIGKIGSKLPADKAEKFIVNAAKKLNESKILNSMSKALTKVPSGIKKFGATVVDYSPWLLVATSIGHSFSHDRAKMVQTQNNYNDIKMAQAEAREILTNADVAE